MQPPTTITIRISDDPPKRLDKALARDVPADAALSRSRIARLIADGAVRCGDRVLSDPSGRVAAGEVLTLMLDPPAVLEARAEAIALDIRFEDEDLVVVNKPVGMVVHPAPGTPDGTLVNALLAHCGDSLSGIGGVQRPGIVHRIDKDTSGVLVVAKSDRAHHGLAEQFAAHSVTRRYLALVHGCPDAADARLRGLKGVAFEPGGVLRIATMIGRHRTDRQKQAVLDSGGKAAVTRARVMDRFGSPPAASLVECWLETGRTHQIRVHMAYAGHALLGDQTYGTRRKLSRRGLPEQVCAQAEAFPRQALHAAELGFLHPVSGESLHFSAPLPADMAGLVALLSDAD
ncbi:MAG: RluA family pseudouridine synthase [Rhodobacteraceae bacterium]|nr:RluA family pseudouridine synthase [Paracoccaceae bacterium]